ncbi:MAG: type II toxin-antitoxin system RelE/ParE family toxin [Bacteroidota bacterium]
MKYQVTILSDAEQDISNAFVWYEMQQIGLGSSFYKTLDHSVSFISNNPLSCSVVYKNVRRFVIKKFPFGIYYDVNAAKMEIQIIGVFHFKRSSKVLRKRK